jgi:hypothetical protein
MSFREIRQVGKAGMGYIYIGHPLGQIMSLQQASQTLQQQNMVFPITVDRGSRHMCEVNFVVSFMSMPKKKKKDLMATLV